MNDQHETRPASALLRLVGPPVVAAAAATLSLAQEAETVPRPAAPAPPVARVTAPAPIKIGRDLDADRLAAEADFRRRLIPQPIEADRFESLLTQLDVADDKRARLVKEHAEYLDRHKAARGDLLRKLEVLLPASFRYDPALNQLQPVYTPELLEALRLRASIVRSVLDYEGTLDEGLGAACSDSKRNLLRAFRAQRAQELYGAPARLPGATVNLLELVPKCGLTGEELASIESFFETYATSYVEQLRGRWLKLLAIEYEEAETLTSLGPEWRVGRSDKDALEIERSLSQLDVAVTLTDRAISELNESSLVTLRSSLPPLASRKVIEAYRKIVHPEVFDDERAHRLLVEEMIGLPSLDEKTIGGIVQSLASIEDRLRALGTQATQLADGIIEAESLPAPDAAAARVMLQSKLQGILEKRRRIIRDGVNALRPMVPSGEGSFIVRLDDALAMLAARDRAGRFLRDGYDARIGEIAILEAERAAEAEESAREAERNENSNAPAPETQTISPNGADTPPPAPPRRTRGTRGG
ncbi:MAG: hypothetical protein JNM94_00990 [Phycisphaerae bacterium]|nr:hypothetical protein [Phycisphaerae bacterium]